MTAYPNGLNRPRNVAAGIIIAASLSSAAFAQGPAAADAAWYGLPLPGPATGLTVDFSRRDMPVLPAPPADAPYMRGETMMTAVERIVGFSYASRDAGDRPWGRMAGSPHTEAMIDYVAAALTAAGVKDVQKRPVPFVRLESPSAWSLRLLGRGAPVLLRSAMPLDVQGAADRGGGGVAKPIDAQAMSAPPRVVAVTAPLAYVGDASPAAVASADLKGKIAVYTVEPSPAPFYGPGGMARTLTEAGAVGVIVIYNLPGNMQSAIGDCPAGLPCFQLGGEDGGFLRAVIARSARTPGAVQAELSITRQPPTPLTAHVLVAKIAGRDHAENLVISAHSDAFFAGANDNASGVAGLIALASHYVRHPPKHDLYVFLSAGHHEGTGGMAPLTDAFPALAKTNIVALNLEHIGQAGVYRSLRFRTPSPYGPATAAWTPTNWDSPGREVTMTPESPALKAAWVTAATKFQYTAPARFGGPVIAEPARLVALGGAAVQNVETSPWFHTSGDEPQAMSPQAMQRVVLFYRAFLDSADAMTRAQVWKDVPPKAAP